MDSLWAMAVVPSLLVDEGHQGCLPILPVDT
jgi:hypothetical protein